MGQIEQAGLLRAFRYFPLEVVAGLKKLCLDAAPNGSKPGKERRK